MQLSAQDGESESVKKLFEDSRNVSDVVDVASTVGKQKVLSVGNKV